MRRASGYLVVLATAAAVAAGCGGGAGGGGGGGERLSRDEFRSQLNEICSNYNEFVDSVETPKSASDVPGWVDKILPKFRDTVDRAKKLRPPEDLQDRFDEFLSNGDDEADLLEQIRDAAKSADVSKIQTLQARGTELDNRSDEIANEIGATDCTGD